MEQIEAAMRCCMLCPRECGVNRLAGEKGFCGETAVVRAARAALHAWEEPCISGREGSGTVFFTGCSLKCSYCQNAKLASGDAGREIGVNRLADIFLELQDKGANNINLVTPTHFVPQIAAALRLVKNGLLRIPVVYNTGGYEKTETLRQLEGLVDIYLPDFKYLSAGLAQAYSRAPDYGRAAKRAIAEMVRQAGGSLFRTDDGMLLTAETWNERLEAEETKRRRREGRRAEQTTEEEFPDDYGRMPMMIKGVIVRHLLLPGGLEDSKRILFYLHRTYGNRIYISIMNQYTPLEAVKNHPVLSRRVTEAEYEELVEYALDIGIENGFIQGSETAEESFIPTFDYEGI